MARLPAPLAASITGACMLGASLWLTGGAAAQSQCRPLMPVGGSGNPVVEKRISPDRLGVIGGTNWNTDFAVDKTYASYRINIQSASTSRGTFPVAAFLRFTNNSNLQVVNETITLEPDQSRSFGPFPAVPGKRTNQVNVRVGSRAMPGSTGFSYRVSVDGCN
jgi:hypothetical protein